MQLIKHSSKLTTQNGMIRFLPKSYIIYTYMHVVQTELCPTNAMLKSYSIVPQSVTVFGEKILKGETLSNILKVLKRNSNL